MDKKEFLKLSFQLDKSGKFEEADKLFEKLQKFSQANPPKGTGKTYKVDKGTAYVNQDPDIAKYNLGTGISPSDWFRGINIQFGGGFDREDYIPGSENELITFKIYFMKKWPGIETDSDGNVIPKQIPKKDEFFACLLKAQSELESIARNGGITLTFSVDNSIVSFFEDPVNSFRHYFTEFSRWVEAQARIYSKDLRFTNYIIRLRMAETVLASQIAPQIKTPKEQVLQATPDKLKTPSGASTGTAPGAAKAPTPDKKPNTTIMSRQKIENPAKLIDSGKSVY